MQNLTIQNAVLKLAYYDFECFCSLIIKQLRPEWVKSTKLHILLKDNVSWYLNPKQKEYELLLINASPRSGKSSISTHYATAFFLGKHISGVAPQVLLMSKTDGSLRLFYDEIRKIINSGLYTEIFGVGIVASRRGEYIKLSNGASLIFKTTNADIEIGSAYHLIICDDVAEYSDMKSEKKRKNLQDKIESVLGRKQINPRTKVIFINQILATNDISLQIIRQYEERGLKYHRICLPFLFTKRTIFNLKLRENCVVFNKSDYILPYITPEIEAVERARFATESRFNAEYQQDPTDNVMSMFKRKYLQYYSYENLAEIIDICKRGSGFLFTTDFGYTVDGDFSCVCLWGKGEDGTVYFIDGLQAKKTIEDMQEVFFNFYEKWHNNLGLDIGKVFAIVERNGNLALIPNLRNIGMSIYTVARNAKQNKIQRAEQAVINTYQFNKFYLPDRHFYKDVFELQLTSFLSDGTGVSNDDFVDNASDAMNYSSVYRNS